MPGTPLEGHEMVEHNRTAWDAIAGSYQAGTRISTTDVHYGPFAPGERELGLLGDVEGKRVLEVGCGGGQNAIALAKWGAICTGLDPSAEQLGHARQLARENGVEVHWIRGTAENLGSIADESVDLVLSSYAFEYVADLKQAYLEAGRVLVPGGTFVFCFSHPWFQAVGWHLAGDPEAPEIGAYAAWPMLEEWDWSFEDGTAARLRSYDRPLGQIVNELIDAGFVLERLVEQPYEDLAGASPKEIARLPYTHDVDPSSPEYEISRKLPRTLLIRARKQP
jgi:ubiquinone/menaquinone biosynthesis C-methylase UbiE